MTNETENTSVSTVLISIIAISDERINFTNDRLIDP